MSLSDDVTAAKAASRHGDRQMIAIIGNGRIGNNHFANWLDIFVSSIIGCSSGHLKLSRDTWAIITMFSHIMLLLLFLLSVADNKQQSTTIYNISINSFIQ